LLSRKHRSAVFLSRNARSKFTIAANPQRPHFGRGAMAAAVADPARGPNGFAVTPAPKAICKFGHCGRTPMYMRGRDKRVRAAAWRGAGGGPIAAFPLTQRLDRSRGGEKSRLCLTEPRTSGPRRDAPSLQIMARRWARFGLAVHPAARLRGGGGAGRRCGRGATRFFVSPTTRSSPRPLARGSRGDAGIARDSATATRLRRATDAHDRGAGRMLSSPTSWRWTRGLRRRRGRPDFAQIASFRRNCSPGGSPRQPAE